MEIDPKVLMPPVSIEDTAEFLANTFFPTGDIDPYNFQVVMQWVMGIELTDEDVAFALERFYKRVVVNGYPT